MSLPTPRARACAESGPMLTIKDLTVRLGVSDKTIRRLIRCGDLAAHYVGRQIRISEEDLAAYLHVRRRDRSRTVQTRPGEA